MTPSGKVGLTMVLSILTVVVFVPFAIPLDPLAQDLSSTLDAPGKLTLLGTDHLGRSILSRLICGGRLSLMISCCCTAIALFLGLCLGMLAGYREGWIDLVVMRVTDATLAFPGTLLAIVLVGTLGGSFMTLMAALCATMWCEYCRLSRNMTRSVKHAIHLEAGKLMGYSDRFLIRRYILPELLPQLFTLSSLSMGRTILNISGLGFLGIGLQPPQPEWGAMINQGIGFMSEAPWLVVAPGSMIFLTVLGFQLLADSGNRAPSR